MDTPVVSGPGQMSQRSDQAPGQPIRVPTGLPYGQAKQVENAQQAVPLPQGPPGGQPGPTPDQSGPPQVSQAMPDARGMLDVVGHPTDRPTEPVTTLPPGAANNENATLGSLLDRLAASGSSEAAYLAAAVNSGRQ